MKLRYDRVSAWGLPLVIAFLLAVAVWVSLRADEQPAVDEQQSVTQTDQQAGQPADQQVGRIQAGRAGVPGVTTTQTR